MAALGQNKPVRSAYPTELALEADHGFAFLFRYAASNHFAHEGEHVAARFARLDSLAESTALQSRSHDSSVG